MVALNASSPFSFNFTIPLMLFTIDTNPNCRACNRIPFILIVVLIQGDVDTRLSLLLLLLLLPLVMFSLLLFGDILSVSFCDGCC